MTVEPWEEYCKLVMDKLDKHDEDSLILHSHVSKLHERINGLVLKALLGALGILVYIIQDVILT